METSLNIKEFRNQIDLSEVWIKLNLERKHLHLCMLHNKYVILILQQ